MARVRCPSPISVVHSAFFLFWGCFIVYAIDQFSRRTATTTVYYRDCFKSSPESDRHHRTTSAPDVSPSKTIELSMERYDDYSGNITVTEKVILFGIDEDDEDDGNPTPAWNVNILTDAEEAALPPKQCIKTVLIHSYLHYMARSSPSLKLLTTLLQSSTREDYGTEINCVSYGYDCNLQLTISPRIGSLRSKDAVIFGMDDITWNKKPALLTALVDMGPGPDQTWIYYSPESTQAGRANITNLKYHARMASDLNSDIHVPFAYYRRFDQNDSRVKALDMIDGVSNRTAFISWTGASCDKAQWPRVSLVQELRKVLPLDDYGKCGSNGHFQEGTDECYKLYSSYKFSLLLPDEECHDRITEPFWTMLLKYGNIPVVLGSPRTDYERVAPPNSFIHAGDFGSLPELASFLRTVSGNETLYRAYHAWRKDGEVVRNAPLDPSSTLCQTVPQIYDRTYSHIDEPSSFKVCRQMPGSNSFSENIEDNYKNWTIWR